MSETVTRSSGDRVVVELGDRGYDIHLVDGPVTEARQHAGFWSDLLAHFDARDIALVTNTTLWPLFGDAVAATLAATGRRVVPIVVPDGERFKNAEMLATIHDTMLDVRLDRRAMLVALGGGVVGDVAGFAAATYQRGIRFIQIPTTLLAQVDSSVGGKTGINHRLGKNMIGAFHQPTTVVVDLATLRSLPPRELAAGLAEVIKYGISLDAEFFKWLEGAMPALRAGDPASLRYAIRRCCELKAAIVGHDEREEGDRALLNFGHTFGHAIEGATGYGAWLHGEAVAAGMILAARLSKALDLIDSDTLHRLTALVAAAGLPVEPPVLSVADWRRWMAGDKKATGGRLRFILLVALGSARVGFVDDATLDATLAGLSASASPTTAVEPASVA